MKKCFLSAGPRYTAFSVSEVCLRALIAEIAVLAEMSVPLEALLPYHVSENVTVLCQILRCDCMLLVAVATPELVDLPLYQAVRDEGLALVDDVLVEEVRKASNWVAVALVHDQGYIALSLFIESLLLPQMPFIVIQCSYLLITLRK